jgi:hypothetical protein
MGQVSVPKGRQSCQGGALLVPVPVLGLYPLGPKNGATHLPPTLMRYESPSPAPATVERAGLERHIASAWAATTATATTRPEPFLALLRKHGGSTISAIP